ncbi:MAG TPA: DUF72 domain-containing protein [Candidatus Saccharimonadales bacterium]|nr:DUF72 domain-containing protein [Candidatus Saccharimonadales bacterium]
MPAPKPPEIRFGPAGWSYADWKGIFYPKRRPRGFSEPGYIAEFFDTIEINTSFYNPLNPDHCRQWTEQVSGNPRFLFTAKLWQKFTHEIGATAEDEKSVRSGFDVLREKGKLGAVLLQFPFSFHNNQGNLARLQELLARFRDYPLVVEVRHATWNEKPFFDLLAEHRAGFCNIDQPIIGRSLEPTDHVTSPIGYVRFHGRRYDTWFSEDPEIPAYERYNYLYSSEELKPWAARVEKIEQESKSIYVITNNHFAAKSIVTALTLMHILNKSRVKVPEPLRDHYPQLDKIADQPRESPTLFPAS